MAMSLLFQYKKFKAIIGFKIIYSITMFGLFMVRNHMNDNLPNSKVSSSSLNNLSKSLYSKNAILY